MEVVQQVLAIALVFGLLGLVVWKLRRGNVSLIAPLPWGRARVAGRAVETLERVALTPQHAVHLVRVNGRELVVVTHPQGCSFLVQQHEDQRS